MAETYVNPVVSVAADLSVPMQEVIGPKTNQKTVAMFHPDRCQTSATKAYTDFLARSAQRVCWLPDKNLTNMEVKHGHIVPSQYPNGEMLQGENGQYVKAQYAKSVIPSTAAPMDTYGAVTVPADRQVLSILQTSQS